MNTDSSRLIEVALRAGRLAASVCQRVQREEVGDGVQEKTGREPVTIADYASQALILRELMLAFPDHAVVSEEDSNNLRAKTGERLQERICALVSDALSEKVTLDDVCRFIDHAGKVGGDYCWSVDPIDGTKGFLRGDQYAVAIGLLHKHQPVAGVLVCPSLAVEVERVDKGPGVALFAERGSGAFQEPLAGGERVAIRASKRSDPASVRVLGSVESAHGDPALVKAMVDRLGLGGGIVRVDSQVKYGVLARGGAEVYLRPRSRPDYRDNIWDHVAGSAIAVEAGARCTDQEGAELDFSCGPKLERNKGVLCTNGLVHDLVVDAIRAVESLRG